MERKKEANEMEKELNLKRESIEQIRQLIEAQTEPSEEWIEEKAREIHDTVYSGHACNYECSLMMKCQDFIRTIVKDCRPKVSREKIFVEHIEQHLKDLKIKGKVLCKICGKDIDTIAQEAGAEE
ncbi:MAG: hypothetical protein KAT69_04755 [Candidatus Aminicenantes bacterium]|nr:hypothetical protein [Candidatus Aminicenantes bacterium]